MQNKTLNEYNSVSQKKYFLSPFAPGVSAKAPFNLRKKCSRKKISVCQSFHSKNLLWEQLTKRVLYELIIKS